MNKSGKEKPPGNEFDTDGNFLENRGDRNHLEGGPKIESLEVVNSKKGGEVVRIERRSNKDGQPEYEYKLAYKNKEAKDRGELAWGNEDRFRYDDTGRVTFKRKVAFSDEKAFQNEGKMDRGHEINIQYLDDKNIEIAEGRHLVKEKAWRTETQKDDQGRNLTETTETTEGKTKGRITRTNFSYREGDILHGGEEYKDVVITTEDGVMLETGAGTDPNKKTKGDTWQKIVVHSKNGKYLNHWRTKE